MNKDFSYYLSKFLQDYLVVERNASNNTINSYRGTFKQLIDYLVNIKEYKLVNINFKTVTLEIIIEFLNYLESEKGNSIKTRNQRLAAIKSFYRFCAIYEVDNIDNIRKILSIKAKKGPQKLMNYLTEDELKNLFGSIDVATEKGKRNLVLLTLLYDTAARASEIINLKLEDINLEEKYIILNGKGNKKRVVPIMEQTKQLLISYFNQMNRNFGYVFQKNGKPMNDRFIRDVLNKCYTGNKNITPHAFRHSRAVHLLDHGVNIVYIQELLGHTSIETTRIYATVIEKTKFEAIEKATPQYNNEKFGDWNDDQDLLTQLLNM